MTRTLVDIPTTVTLDGFSPLLQARQRIDARALPALVLFAAAFHARHARRLIITEGSRTRPRQLFLWDNRVELGVAVAVPYTSRHDEINHGTALDLGSGIATLGTPAQRWAAANAPLYGLAWTGAGFREAWHYEVVDLAPATTPTTTPAPPLIIRPAPTKGNTVLIVKVTDAPTKARTNAGENLAALVKPGFTYLLGESGRLRLTDQKEIAAWVAADATIIYWHGDDVTEHIGRNGLLEYAGPLAAPGLLTGRIIDDSGRHYPETV